MDMHTTLNGPQAADAVRPNFAGEHGRVLAAAAGLSMSAVPGVSPDELPGPEIDPSPAPVEIPATPPVSTPPPPAPTPITDRRVAAPLAWGVLTAAALWSANALAAPLDSADRRFMDEAAAGGMVEIVFGRIAQEKAQAEPVRQFGLHMVDDHNKANEALKAIAAAKGVQLPTGLTSDEKATVSRLKKLKGPNFDRQYMARMLADHQKTVALFAHASTAASDPDLKQFAATTLPTVKSHLEMARQILATPAAPARKGTAARE